MVESTTEARKPEETAPEFITREAVVKTPKSTWYRYKLHCGHYVYTRVRITFRASFQQHFVRCPQEHPTGVTGWQAMEGIEAVSDEHVSNVLSGTSFILPNRILRTDGDNGPSGNPFPYTTIDRDY